MQPASSLLASFSGDWHFVAENWTRQDDVSTTDSLRWTEVRRINRTSRNVTDRDDSSDERSKRFDISFFAGPPLWTQIVSILNRLSRKKKTEKTTLAKKFWTFYNAIQDDVESLQKKSFFKKKFELLKIYLYGTLNM